MRWHTLGVANGVWERVCGCKAVLEERVEGFDLSQLLVLVDDWRTGRRNESIVGLDIGCSDGRCTELIDSSLHHRLKRDSVGAEFVLGPCLDDSRPLFEGRLNTTESQ